jgi:hypothetical protein
VGRLFGAGSRLPLAAVARAIKGELTYRPEIQRLTTSSVRLWFGCKGTWRKQAGNPCGNFGLSGSQRLCWQPRCSGSFRPSPSNPCALSELRKPTKASSPPSPFSPTVNAFSLPVGMERFASGKSTTERKSYLSHYLGFIAL